MTGFAAGEPEWRARLGSLRQAVRQELVARQLAEQVPDAPPRRVLDVGCGQGTQALRLARRGHRVTGLDGSDRLLADFEAALSVEPATVRDRVTLVRADIAQLHAPAGDPPPGGPARDERADVAAGDERADVAAGGVPAGGRRAGVAGGAVPAGGEPAGGGRGGLFGPASFDVVLCHGVLMYFDDPAPLLADLARVLAPGGVLSLLVRNGDALAMRPGLTGDWTAARRAFTQAGYLNRIGVQARADRRADLTAALAGLGLSVPTWYGVRVFTDTLAADSPVPDDETFAAILDAEDRAGRTDPYRAVAPLLHLIALRG
ncbi:class I SAM-dependent methyltransferase [Actinocatenispora sera]|uniref:Methyltransferase n=1 Tax=Actinocatenispora sera TaxID=390989 RepID=A0A810KWS4_9ACTN|nr:methyltransferase domain-containing protein [Actinocatenispora sera]BCJ26786.1 methyltransferase [Actinocatenispora sera]